MKALFQTLSNQLTSASARAPMVCWFAAAWFESVTRPNLTNKLANLGGALTLLMLAAALLTSSSQGWLLDRTESVVRRLHEGPGSGRSTVWVRLTPSTADGAPGPTALVLVAEFPGRSAPPDALVQLQVMSDVRISPLVPRMRRLDLTLDAGVVVDLLAPGEGAVVSYCCGDLISPIPVGASVNLRPGRLDELAGAASISGNALGVPFRLSATEVASIKAFRKALTTP